MHKTQHHRKHARGHLGYQAEPFFFLALSSSSIGVSCDGVASINLGLLILVSSSRSASVRSDLLLEDLGRLVALSSLWLVS